MTLEAAAPRSPARTIPWPLFFIVAMAGIGVCLISLIVWGQGAEGWLHAARYTARLSFLIFLAPFLASSLLYWFPWPATRWMRAKRRYLGLSFALAHFIHLIALTVFSILADRMPGLVTLFGGGSAYAMIFLMAATSNDWSVRTLGPKAWGWLHWLGLYDIWFIFAFSYFGRVTKDAPQEPRIIYITLFGLAVAALLTRLSTAFTRRPPKRADT